MGDNTHAKVTLVSKSAQVSVPAVAAVPVPAQKNPTLTILLRDFEMQLGPVGAGSMVYHLSEADGFGSLLGNEDLWLMAHS